MHCKHNLYECNGNISSCDLLRVYPSPLAINPFSLKLTVFKFRSYLLNWLLFSSVPFLKNEHNILSVSQEVHGFTFFSPVIMSLSPVISSFKMPSFLSQFLTPSWLVSPAFLLSITGCLLLRIWELVLRKKRAGVSESLQMQLHHLDTFFKPQFPYVLQ